MALSLIFSEMYEILVENRVGYVIQATPLPGVTYHP